ncbi:hypothetical protein PVAP13_6KG110026 [Panicum virgatum]|uniref:MATH domain-containing protein n=1 Tax=Panicum virgatum TaxID=38727 RepID=A0A8T0RB82_PANVG|nr:hypothetical protein PVAP13_6KG110026 [Panicum virgatum]
MPPSRRFFRRLWPSSSSSSPRRAAPPTTTTVSTSTPGTAQGRHVFEINGYSKHRGMGMGDADANFVRSGTFSVGGHDWSILFCSRKKTVTSQFFSSSWRKAPTCERPAT